MSTAGKFRLTILDPDSVIYKGEVSSLYVYGNMGEFELLAYHYPVLCLLKEDTDVVIDWREFVTIKRGILKFFKNECVLIVELMEDHAEYYKKRSLI